MFRINDGTIPSYSDIEIIDGFYILHCFIDVPQTFGNIAKAVLKKITNTRAKEIHLIFDQYFQPSIKDYERSTRGNKEADHDFFISGPNQKRPVEFAKELLNNKFKVALVRFFILHWSDKEVAPVIQNKTIFVNFVECHRFSVDANGNVNTSIVSHFSCPAHEEADTKIIYHACQILEDSNIIIKCSDTDILITLLSNMHNLKSNSKIWIESGVSGTTNYIDVCKVYENFGEILCKA